MIRGLQINTDRQRLSECDVPPRASLGGQPFEHGVPQTLQPFGRPIMARNDGVRVVVMPLPANDVDRIAAHGVAGTVIVVVTVKSAAQSIGSDVLFGAGKSCGFLFCGRHGVGSCVFVSVCRYASLRYATLFRVTRDADRASVFMGLPLWRLRR